MSAYWWDAIGYYDSNYSYLSFRGNYLGEGYNISNLYVSGSDGNCAGLFGYTVDAVICDINIEDLTLGIYYNGYNGGISAYSLR